MDYIDLRLGDFLENFVQMSDVIVYDTTYTDMFLFQARVGAQHTIDIGDSALPNGAILNDYGIVYVSSTDRGLEIGVVEI